MAKSEDWYRNDRWSKKAEAAFFARLGRSRSPRHKARYARLKASCLEGSGDSTRVRAAVDLLSRVLRDWPAETEAAHCLHLLARCHLRLGDVDSAVEHFQRTLRQEKACPEAVTNAWSDYARLVATRNLREHYGDILRLLRDPSRWSLYPADRFTARACRSLIAWENGSKMSAREEADLALAELERPHEHKLIVDGLDELVARLRRIAR